MRRYLQIRDETCQGIGCTQRATLSEIDHTQAWNTGGQTHVDNLVHLCKACHRLKHQSSFSTSQGPNGVLTWTTPGGKKYTSRPVSETVQVAPPVAAFTPGREAEAEAEAVSDAPPPF
jgi:hypothetical protein